MLSLVILTKCTSKFKLQRSIGTIWGSYGERIMIYQEIQLTAKCVCMSSVRFLRSLQQLALRRTAPENKLDLRFEAPNTLRNNFYIDVFLKSVYTEDSAIKLIKKLKAMCAESGFNIIKFISNSKRLLQAISDNDRKTGMKDNSLCTDLLHEQALGVLWNGKSDTSGFKSNIRISH